MNGVWNCYRSLKGVFGPFVSAQPRVAALEKDAELDVLCLTVRGEVLG